MTVKVFWIDSYQKDLYSVVTSVEGNKIQLSETIFYAESGGQESDKGTIGEINVIKAEKVGKTILYTLESNPDFKVGDTVLTRIDWNRRYSLMKLHFAAEIVLELFNQNYSEIKKIGANISEAKSRIDFQWDGNIGEVLPEIERKAHEIIYSDLNITSGFLNEDAERRYWEIPGFGQAQCGGTHLKKTSEIGEIKLNRKNIGKGKERVEITLV